MTRASPPVDAEPKDSGGGSSAGDPGTAAAVVGSRVGVSAGGLDALAPYAVHPREYYQYRLKGVVVLDTSVSRYYSLVRASDGDVALDGDDGELARERWYRCYNASVAEVAMTEEALETETFGGTVERWETDVHGSAVKVKRDQVGGVCCGGLIHFLAPHPLPHCGVFADSHCDDAVVREGVRCRLCAH